MLDNISVNQFTPRKEVTEMRQLSSWESVANECKPQPVLNTKVNNMNLISVAEQSSRAGINRNVECEFFGQEEDAGYACPEEPTGNGPRNITIIPEEELSSVKFAEDIKIDFIPMVDYRILCRFLGISSVSEVQNTPFTDVPLITFMIMESAQRFMKSIGYNFAGELNFARDGSVIPVIKNPWMLNGKEVCFTIHGFQYYESQSKNKKENIAFYFFTDLDQGGSSITCFSTDSAKCKSIIHDMKEFAKSHNCLRGTKIRDLNTISATFSEVENYDKYTWENYYYDESVRSLFELEVFGFLKNIKKYNDHGIKRRGLMLEGPAGTGKTTIGYLICHYSPDNTVIWITPEILTENDSRIRNSIKTLYRVADYLSPCAIILEDLDLVGQDRASNRDVMALGTLMNVLDGVNSVDNSVTIATTNRLEIIEKALRNRPGRFDRIIEIPAMEATLRKKMFVSRLFEWEKDDDLIDYVVSKTDGWTPAEIQEFVITANLRHINSNAQEKKMDMLMVDGIIEIMQQFGIGGSSSQFGFRKSE